MKNFLQISFLFLFVSTDVFGSVEVKYFNERFVWIKVPSKFVKAGLNLPVEGYSVCWIEVKTPEQTFDFVFRRGLEYKDCLNRVSEIRKLLKKNTKVEIIGNGGSKHKVNDYFAMWELIRGSSECEGYFGGCEDFENETPEWNDWKAKPIDPKLYP